MNRSEVSPRSPSGHVPPEALLRRLDEVASPEEVAAIEHHLVACDRCRQEAERIERQSRDFGALLAKAHPTVPATWHPPARRPDRSSWWWAVAAIFATVVMVGAVAPPVRAWVVDRLQSILGGDNEQTIVDAADEDRMGQQDDPVEGSGNVVVFQPSGEEFAIDVSGMITGRLTITVSNGGAATAEVVEGVPPEIVVLSNGLRVMADSALETELQVNLPATVRRILVSTDSRMLGSYDVDSSAVERTQRWEVRLGRQ